MQYMADACLHFKEAGSQSGRSYLGASAGKRQRVSPHDDAFHFFNRADADKEGQRKPHLEEAAMALLLLDVHSAPGKVTRPPSRTTCTAPKIRAAVQRRTGVLVSLQQSCSTRLQQTALRPLSDAFSQ